MGFKDQLLASRRHISEGTNPASTAPDGRPTLSSLRSKSQQRQDSDHVKDADLDAEIASRRPKRSSSFGRGLSGGLSSLASGMTKAGDSLSRKSIITADGMRTPPVNGKVTTPGSDLMPPPKLPDSGHLPQFSLRLSELVNKAFAPCAQGATGSGGGAFAGAAKSAAGITGGSHASAAPPLVSVVYEGRRLPNRDATNEIAVTVVSELEYAASVDTYLLRAVSRSALKALTLFADRMDSLVVTASKDASALAIPHSAKDGTHPPAALEYNLGLISLEWIVEDALERCIEGAPGTFGQGMPHFVSEILTPVRKKMEATIAHIVQPLLASIKSSITASISKAVPAPFVCGGSPLSPIPSSVNVPPLPSPGTPTATPAPIAPSPPSSAPGATWIKELEGKMEGTRRLLVPRLVQRCGQDGEGWFISIAIHAVWKGLMIMSSRSAPPPGPISSKWPVGLLHSATHVFATDVGKRSPSPAQLSSALKSVGSVARSRKSADLRSTSSGAVTPVTAQTPAQVSATLANASAKCTMAQVADLQALERIVIKFAGDYLPRDGVASSTGSGDAIDDSSSSSSDDDDEDELARKALAEALHAIKSTITVVQYLDIDPEALLDSVRGNRGRGSSSARQGGGNVSPDAVRAVRAIPPLILLHLLYARMPAHLGVFATSTEEGGKMTPPAVTSPPATFGISWTDYERSISGFSGAQRWAVQLVDEWAQDIEEAQAEIRQRKHAAEASSDEKNDVQGLNIPGITTKAHESAQQALGQDEATPTPESVLLQRTSSAATHTDGLSSSRSSDSLPNEMTNSAPTLDREKERAAKEVVREVSAQQPDSKEPARLAWGSKLRKPSRSPAQSAGSSPSHTPNISPPLSPSKENVENSTGPALNSRSTSRSRFWRTASSSNANGANHAIKMPSQAAAASASRASLMGFASGNKSRHASTSSSTAEACPTMSEEERRQDELRLERASLQLLSKGLEATSYICRIPSPTAAPLDDSANSSSGSVHPSCNGSVPRLSQDVSLGASHADQQLSSLSLHSTGSHVEKTSA